MPSLAIVAAFTAYHFRLYANRTVYRRVPSDDLKGVTAEDCQRFCHRDIFCSCVVFTRSGGRCSKRRSCTAGRLQLSPGHDIYVRIGGGEAPPNDPTSVTGAIGTSSATTLGLRSASSAPAEAAGARRACAPPLLPSCSFSRPEGLVNMSMTMDNVDLSALEADPIIRSKLEGIIKAAIAEVAGHNLTRDDVLLELSTSDHFPDGLFPAGSLVLLAVVQPQSDASAGAVGQALRSADLGRVLSTKASTAVGSTQVATGPVSIRNVMVFPEGSGLPHWLVLVVAFVLLVTGAAALRVAAVGYCAQRVHCKAISREERELVSCQEPPDDMPSTGREALQLRFIDTEGDERVMHFTCRPVGITFDEIEPTRVAGFPVGSHAKTKGVKVGWVLSQIASAQIPRHCSREEVQRCLEQHSEDLDPWPLRMDFETSEGVVRTVYIEEGPLGISFLNSLPIVVDGFKPGSTARELGVERGWALTRIGDMDLRGETDLHTVLSYVIDGVGQLPRKCETARSSRSVSNPDYSRSREPLLRHVGWPATGRAESLYL